ncbi:MAG TPA: NADH-quinone oxidoreductase subunit J [Bacteroidales bacterium]|jgi:NADH-quinone oxidoreductase subunit J|nr:NADH-quinone oxidoreductase subunit J [Bacteroidales bacterium]
MNNQVMFFLLSAIILIFSVLTVTTRRVLRAAVYLLFVLVATAGIYFQLQYNFLAAVQLTVYAGGIVVLIIFSILLTSHISERAPRASAAKAALSALAAVAGAILVLLTVLQFNFTPAGIAKIEPTVTNVGRALVSYKEYGYALPFEAISILLLAAMIGAIVVAKKESNQEKQK